MSGVWAQVSGRAVAETAFGSHLGFQAFTVRDLLLQAPAETMRRLAAVGYKEIELYDPAHAATLSPIAKECGLRIVGSHMPSLLPSAESWRAWRAAGEPPVPPGYDLEKIFAIAQSQQLDLLGYASYAPEQAFVSEADYLAYAKLLEGIGARCRARGITFVYHNHSREFANIGKATFFDLIAKNTSPSHVAFEVDVCWAAQAGIDPTVLIRRLGKRVRAIHLKDRTADIST